MVDAHGGGARFLAKGDDATFSPDGKTVLYGTAHGDLYTMPTDGGDPRLLLASPAPAGAELNVNGLAWSPDGSKIRFVRSGRYWEITAEGKNPHEILPGWHTSNPKYFMCCGRWTPDGDFFLFTAGGSWYATTALGGWVQIWDLDERRSWLHRSNREPAQLTDGPMLWAYPIVSRDGKTLYSTGAAPRAELVGYDAKSKKLLPYLGGISAEYVAFSRDGKSLVYVTYPEGTMWRANRDGSELQQLTNPPMHPVNPWWSPDGTQILFSDMSRSDPHVMYTVSSHGGEPTRLLPGDKEIEVDPSWSPDGKKVVFEQDQVGKFAHVGAQIRILEMDTRKITDLPPCPKDCWSPRWSPDGRYILALASLDMDDLALFDLRTNRWSLLNLKLGAIGYPTWSHDGRFIYFESSNDFYMFPSKDPGIHRIPVSGGRVEKLVDLKGFKDAGFLNVWSGLDPDDNPLLLRDASISAIYALTLERK